MNPIKSIVFLLACVSSPATTFAAINATNQSDCPVNDSSLLAAVRQQNILLTEQVKLLKQINYNTEKLLQGARTGGYYR